MLLSVEVLQRVRINHYSSDEARFIMLGLSARRRLLGCGAYCKRRSAGVRGKYAEQYRSGTNVVVLEPDVAEAFPDSESVNEALRGLLATARRDDSGEHA
jgi:hypothetical protein